MPAWCGIIWLAVLVSAADPAYPISRCTPSAATLRPEENVSISTPSVAGWRQRFYDVRWNSLRSFDARPALPMLATLGGDAGELALALEAHTAITGKNVTRASADALVLKFVQLHAVPQQRPLHASIQRAAVDAINSKVSLAGGATLDLTAPPAELHETLLDLLTQPALAGDSFRRWALSPAMAGPATAAAVGAATRAYFRALWASAALGPGAAERPAPGTVVLEVTEGTAGPLAAFLTVESAGCVNAAVGLDAPEAGSVNDAAAVRFQRRALASAACEALGGCHGWSAVSEASEARHEEMLASFRRAARANGAWVGAAAYGAAGGFPGAPAGVGIVGDVADSSECVATHVATALQMAAGTIAPDPAKVESFVSEQALTFVDPAGYTWSCVDGRTAHAALGTPGGTLAEFILALSAFERRAPAFALDEDTVQAVFDEFVDRYSLPRRRRVYMHTSVHAEEDLAAYLGVEDARQVTSEEPPAALRPALLAAAALIKFVGCGHLRGMLMRPDVYKTNATVAAWAIRAYYRALWADAAVSGGRVVLEVLEGDHAEGFLAVIATAGCPGRETPFNPTPLGAPFLDSTRPEAFVLHEAALRGIRAYTAAFFAGLAPALGVPQQALFDDMAAAFPPQMEHTLTALAPGVARVRVLVSAAPSAAVYEALDADAAAAQRRHAVSLAVGLPGVPCGDLTVPVLAELKARLAPPLAVREDDVLVTGLECEPAAGEGPPTARLTVDVLAPRLPAGSALWSAGQLLVQARAAATAGRLAALGPAGAASAAALAEGAAAAGLPRVRVYVPPAEGDEGASGRSGAQLAAPEAGPGDGLVRATGGLAALLGVIGVGLSLAALIVLVARRARGRPPPGCEPRDHPDLEDPRSDSECEGPAPRAATFPGRARPSPAPAAAPPARPSGSPAPAPLPPHAPRATPTSEPFTAPEPYPPLAAAAALATAPPVPLYSQADPGNPFAYDGESFVNPFAEARAPMPP